MKKVVGVVFLVWFFNVNLFAEHIEITVTVGIDDPDAEAIEGILDAMPMLTNDEGEEVAETYEEKLQRITARLVSRFWSERINKLRRYQATSELQSAVVNVE